MYFAYCRVSSKTQNLQKQIENIENYCKKNNINIDKWFLDKESGKDFNRTEYLKMKEQIRKEDIVICVELDRFGRNKDMIKEEWHYITKQIGADIILTDMEILNSANKSDLERQLINDIVFNLYSYMAEKERIKTKERQKDGIAIAKKAGKYKGRQPIKLNREQFARVYAEWKRGLITAKRAMELLGIKANTFYRNVKNFEEENNLRG
ncbi:recombinase family protein [Clostridium sp. UBA1652]|uniref:recombinase family protein n=1 Tax=Clostridium sp. UBA1652 TaxID=1946348 RepID=UPI00257B3FAD|nr:recombinase family protein [Clostridium sp. UBA1652]